MALLTWLWAGPVVAAEPFRVYCNRPAEIKYALHSQPNSWIQTRPDLYLYADIPPGEDVYVQATAPYGWLSEWHGEISVSPLAGDSVELTMTLRPRPINWIITIVGVLAIVMGVWYRFRLSVLRSRREDLENERRHLLAVSVMPGEAIPERIGRYHVVSRLGAGGMATVYQARNTDGMEFALKQPLPHVLENTEFRKRFAREVELGKALQHPNVVRILDHGPEENPYIVMELIDGAPLEEATTPAEVGKTLELAGHVLDALVYIHDRGIVHRDLKPSNIMITRAGAVKVTDFGVAHRDMTIGTRLTGTDQILGTPLYMAPEQVRGEEPTPRVDLYALGVILFQQLTATVPWNGDVLHIITEKLHVPLPPLERPDVPPAVEAFVLRLGALDPADRYPTSAAAREALARLTS